VDHGWLNLVGGCCGTTEKHIAALRRWWLGKNRVPCRVRRTALFIRGLKTVEAEDSTRPLLVGERTNVIGSRLFKNLVAEKSGRGQRIARRQVKAARKLWMCACRARTAMSVGHSAVL